MSSIFLGFFRFIWFRRLFDTFSSFWYHKNIPLIHAKNEIEQTSWIHPKVQEFLIESSLAVNRASTPFDEERFIELLVKYQEEPIRQIAIAYEAPPIFTRRCYATPKGYDIYGGWENIDEYTPGLYGFTRQSDGSIGIVLFMRRDIFVILHDKEYRYIQGAIEQDRRLRRLLGDRANAIGPLAMVGILPGYILKRKEQFAQYPEYITMCEEKNMNSARFVVEATRKTLSEESIPEENLVVLGSHGSLGRVIMERFPLAQPIDLGNLHDMPKSGKYLILDCTVGNTLEKYLNSGLLNTNMSGLWLNEAYPPPTPSVVARVHDTMKVKHILGVDGSVVPSFPGYYGGAIPCCMGLLDQDVNTVRVITLSE